jgi:hypothetical protein
MMAVAGPTNLTTLLGLPTFSSPISASLAQDLVGLMFLATGNVANRAPIENIRNSVMPFAVQPGFNIANLFDASLPIGDGITNPVVAANPLFQASGLSLNLPGAQGFFPGSITFPAGSFLPGANPGALFQGTGIPPAAGAAGLLGGGGLGGINPLLLQGQLGGGLGGTNPLLTQQQLQQQLAFNPIGSNMGFIVPQQANPLLMQQQLLNPLLLGLQQINPLLMGQQQLNPLLMNQQQINPLLMGQQQLNPLLMNQQQVNPLAGLGAGGLPGGFGSPGVLGLNNIGLGF